MSVLLTVNIVSHNPVKSSCDNIPSLPPDNHHRLTRMLSSGGEGAAGCCITVFEYSLGNCVLQDYATRSLWQLCILDII